MKTRTKARLLRLRKTRNRIRRREVPRVCVHKTHQHIYAQVISADGAQVLFQASTMEKSIRESHQGHLGNVAAARVVGLKLGERLKERGMVSDLAFDRSGFKYHGCVQALAQALRESGIAI